MGEGDSEFQLIRRYFRRPLADPAVRLGIGDDAAVVTVPTKMDLVTTMDTLSAGVHFPVTTDASDIAYKALAVNLSDLAAMGAVPQWALLSLSLPGPDEAWLARFADQFHALADRHALSLIGGDLVRGALSVTVQLQGLVPHGEALARDGAKPYDLIYVTGTLGDAGVGLDLVEGGWSCAEADANYFLDCLNRPAISVEAGICLRGIATSAIDISDGLLADLRHILTASGVGAEVRLACLPFSEPMKRVVAESDAWRYALTAGDDYRLCFTVAESERDRLTEALGTLSIHASCIGRVTDNPGRLVCKTPEGEDFVPEQYGYRHF